MSAHFDYMKQKLSVRAFKEYVDTGSRLDFRAFNPAWRAAFPRDNYIARKLWDDNLRRLRDEAYAEALMLCNGDIEYAEHILIEQLIAPPSFTALSDCPTCGVMPAKPRIQVGQEVLEPFCAWCCVIS